ncbi:MAG: hypothetical protein P4L77_10960 [Sulfuriferula sp.]|nr:hypothetical protein [Sulfuriferula sp.]
MAYDNNNRGGGQPNYPQRAMNVLDDNRIRMSAPSTAKGKWASLQWQYSNNDAKLVLWTNDPEDDKKKIDVSLMPVDFCRFLILLTDAIAFPDTGDHKHWMEVMGYTWNGRVRSDEVKTQATLYVGKKDGVVWMSLTSFDKSRPRIKFPFGNTMYNAFSKGDGSPMTDAETSMLSARANLLFLTHCIPTLAVSTYKHKEKKPAGDAAGGGGNRSGGGGNNYGGGGNSGGGNGGDRRGAEDSGSEFDDDIPF